MLEHERIREIYISSRGSGEGRASEMDGGLLSKQIATNGDAFGIWWRAHYAVLHHTCTAATGPHWHDACLLRR